MAQIKDTNVVKSTKVVVDPIFFVPTDVVDVRTLESDNPTVFYESPEDTDVPQETTEDPTQSTHLLGTPAILSVVSQTIKFASDGTATVDVVVEVEDIHGANNYEIRIVNA